MRNCGFCALPAPLSASTCSFCNRPLARQARSLVVHRTGPRFQLEENRLVLCTAQFGREGWELIDARGTRAITLAPARIDAVEGVALLNSQGDIAASLALLSTAGRDAAVLRSPDGALVFVARRDGTTIRLVDGAGEVLAMASGRRGEASGGFDVVLTQAAGELEPLTVFGSLVSLDLHRANALQQQPSA